MGWGRKWPGLSGVPSAQPGKAGLTLQVPKDGGLEDRAGTREKPRLLLKSWAASGHLEAPLGAPSW